MKTVKKEKKDDPNKQQKKLKKLQHFFDKNASLTKRFKALYTYVAVASAEELNKFFNENFYMIYGVFLDTFTAYETNCKKGKWNLKDVQELLVILRNVLLYLSELVRKRWQIRSIASVLEKVLYKENKAPIRKYGFELLLFFLEALQAPEEPQTELLASAVDLTPFAQNYSNVLFKFQPLSAPDKSSILVPTTTPPSIEQSVELMDTLLQHMSNRPEAFAFWWDLFKSKFVTALYPVIAKQLGLLDDVSTGFRPICPWQIQTSLIRELETWLKTEPIAHILWSTEENVKIMLEIYRQSCLLPIQPEQCVATIKKSKEIFQRLFLESPIPEVQPRLIEFRKFYFEKLATVFLTETPKNEEGQQAHSALCLEIIKSLKSIFVTLFDSLENETKEDLMYTMLETTISLLKEGAPNTFLASNLAPILMDTILFLWIRYKSRKPELWKALQEGVSGLFHSMEPVVQTKVKVIQLTLVIKDLIYPVKEKRKKVSQVPPNNSNIQHEVAKDAPPPPKKTEGPTSKCPDSLPKLEEVQRDKSITDIAWTVDDIVYIWNQMHGIFSKLNSIQSAQIHAEAMSCITLAINIIMRAEESLSYEDLLSESRPKSLSLINIFGGLLFECCAVPTDVIMKGKADAYGTLCRMFCRHQVNPLPIKLLANFYGIIHRGLMTAKNNEISWAILREGSNIFNLALPGANVLIPYFLDEIKRVLKADSPAPQGVKMKAITIACSLICYPEHFDGISITVEDTQVSGPKEMKSADIKKNVWSILVETLKMDTLPEHKVMCLWGICVYLFQQIYICPKPGPTLIEGINLIINYCSHEEFLVVRSALDALSCLTLAEAKIRELDEKNDILELVIVNLCANIQRQLKESQVTKNYQLKEALVAEHFYCMLDWLLSSTVYVFDNEKLARSVFESIEMGLFGSKSIINTDSNQKDSKRKGKRNSIKDVDKKDITAHMQVMEAADILLMHLTNFLQNFPSKEGVDIHSSLVTETDDVDPALGAPAPTFYVYNDAIIFSVVQVPHPTGGTAARITLRDQTGKYAWDCLLTYDHPSVKTIEPPYPLFKESNTDNYVPPPDPEITALQQYKREISQLPKFFKDVNLTEVDQLDELLIYLSDTSPDCLSENGQRLNLPVQPLRDFLEKVKITEKALLAQATEDQKVVDHMKANKPPPERWMCKPAEPPVPESPFHYCRLLLEHLGFLLFERRGSFHELENSARFHRSLVQLDKACGREMLKIGVIYVKEGQDDQKVILSNDSKSPLYREFVRGLGWTIDVAQHRGYLGGLDPKLTTGATSPYCANSIMEVVFHEVTAMPTNAADPQQIHKKRHVGNDIVHIVYSEHCRDYSPETITTQFNNAHIIVYPLSNGLFRIQIYRKENIALFGPLLHGMAINKTLLPILVRQTAINANRYVRYNTEGYTRPYPTRRKALEEIAKRYKIQKKYEDVLTEIIQPAPKAAITDSAPAGPKEEQK